MNILERKMTEFQLHRYLTCLLFFGGGTWAFGGEFWNRFGTFLLMLFGLVVSIVIVAAGFWLYGWAKRRFEEEYG